MIVWKQTDRIISAGDHLLRKDPRMTLIKSQNSINLQIANVTPDDRGKFLFYAFSLKVLLIPRYHSSILAYYFLS